METKVISGLELVGVRAKITSPSHQIREIMVYLHNYVYAHGCFLAIPVFMVYESAYRIFKGVNPLWIMHTSLYKSYKAT